MGLVFSLQSCYDEIVPRNENPMQKATWTLQQRLAPLEIEYFCFTEGGVSMKKTLVSALATALVVGAASTTFAAANPFSDVPRDHWAYDAVTQLASDGVIEGYGDGTFRGDRNITRYEMAQMVAKAMAKSDKLNAKEQATIRRLAAEFSDELNNLGARVENLERNADKVKWNGEARYTYLSERHQGEKNKNTNELALRLEPSVEINEHVSVKARINAKTETADDSSDADVKLNRAFADAQWKNLNIKIGKIPTLDNTNVIFDNDNDSFSGASAIVGNKVKLVAGGGRFSGSKDVYSSSSRRYFSTRSLDDTANYWFSGVDYDNGKLNLGSTYHHLASDDLKASSKTGNNPYVDMVGVNANYRFNDNVAVSGSFAKNFNASEQNKSGSFQVNYKNANPSDVGSWGVYSAYRYLGSNASFHNAFEVMLAGQRGYEFGGSYTLFPNTIASLRYFGGSDMNRTNSKNDAKAVFGRIQFVF